MGRRVLMLAPRLMVVMVVGVAVVAVTLTRSPSLASHRCSYSPCPPPGSIQKEAGGEAEEIRGEGCATDPFGAESKIGEQTKQQVPHPPCMQGKLIRALACRLYYKPSLSSYVTEDKVTPAVVVVVIIVIRGALIVVLIIVIVSFTDPPSEEDTEIFIQVLQSQAPPA